MSTEIEQQVEYHTEPATLEETVDSAFSKALASMIMAGFPVASIIAIILGAKATKLIQKADTMAEEAGKKAGSQRTTARVFSLIGIILGSVETVCSAPLLFFAVYYIFAFIVMLICYILVAVGIIAALPSIAMMS